MGLCPVQYDIDDFNCICYVDVTVLVEVRVSINEVGDITSQDIVNDDYNVCDIDLEVTVCVSPERFGGDVIYDMDEIHPAFSIGIGILCSERHVKGGIVIIFIIKTIIVDVDRCLDMVVDVGDRRSATNSIIIQ